MKILLRESQLRLIAEDNVDIKKNTLKRTNLIYKTFKEGVIVVDKTRHNPNGTKLRYKLPEDYEIVTENYDEYPEWECGIRAGVIKIYNSEETYDGVTFGEVLNEIERKFKLYRILITFEDVELSDEPLNEQVAYY
jgi:hypothetical protein